MRLFILVLFTLSGITPKGYSQSVTESTTTAELAITTVSEGTDGESNSTTDMPLDFETNSTEIPNSTTVGPKLGNNSNRGEMNVKIPKDNFCTCNLQMNVCDINCCCDEDCSYNDKQIFSHCQTESRHYDTRYCEYMKYIYINNTPVQWHINQNGLFCIIKSNLPPLYTLQRKQPMKTFDEAKLEKLKKLSWEKYRNYEDRNRSFNEKEKFRYGNHVWLMRNNGIQRFQLPNKFITNRCMITEDVILLKNVANTCMQTDISEENPYLSLKNFFEDIYVIAAPTFVNLSRYTHGLFQDCPRNVCLPIVPKICDAYLNVCVNITKNDTRMNIKCSFNLRENKNICQNVVKTVEYNFYHGYLGFSEIIIVVTLENISHSFGREDTAFTQKFSVNFWWNNQTNNFSESLSGNPGYLIGKPILTGKLVTSGNRTNKSVIIKRNAFKFSDNFLTIPENNNGDCVVTEKIYVTIEFGYNVFTKCKLRRSISNGNRKVNGTEICRKIQKSVLQLWDIDQENKVVGLFGNSNANVHSGWTNILHDVNPKLVLNKTLGTFNSKNNVIFCSGLVTHLIIDIYHSKIDIDDLVNQEKILAVTYSLGFVNDSFVFDNKTHSIFFEIGLKTQVVFYDLSNEKLTKMVESPSLDIKLPHDFFYPFIKVNNGIPCIVATCIIWFNFVLLLGCHDLFQ